MSHGVHVLGVVVSVFLYPFSDVPFTDPQFESRHLVVSDGDNMMTLPVGVHDAGPNAPVVLFFIGNGGTREAFVPMMQPYIDADMTVVSMPYRGGEGIGSRPTEAALKSDALRTFDALPQLLGHDFPAVHLHGFSLGTGVALSVAAERDADSVMLVAPYARICEVVEASALIKVCEIDGIDRWDSIALAGKVSEPVFIAHGLKDRTIPVQHGRRMANALATGGSEVLLHLYSKAHHNDIDVKSDLSSDLVDWVEGGYLNIR
jgi:hypothetical protein